MHKLKITAFFVHHTKDTEDFRKGRTNHNQSLAMFKSQIKREQLEKVGPSLFKVQSLSKNETFLPPGDHRMNKVTETILSWVNLAIAIFTKIVLQQSNA